MRRHLSGTDRQGSGGDTPRSGLRWSAERSGAGAVPGRRVSQALHAGGSGLRPGATTPCQELAWDRSRECGIARRAARTEK